MTRPTEYKPQSISHPGTTLAEKLQELEWDVSQLAARSAIPESILEALLSGKGPITAEVATALEATLLIPARFWLRKQELYQLAQTGPSTPKVESSANRQQKVNRPDLGFPVAKLR